MKTSLQEIRPHPLIDFAHVCGYYSSAATISFTELLVRLLLNLRAFTIRGVASIRINTVFP